MAKLGLWTAAVLIGALSMFDVAAVAAEKPYDATKDRMQKAFPEAEGYGAYSRGGRGGKVCFVTNLSDYGRGEPRIEGSLRAAIDSNEPTIVIFRVSGTIHLKKLLRISSPYITIAGQTAPGDGICIANYSFGVAAHDVIIRYVRVRLGDEMSQQSDAMTISKESYNVIIDHCSASWSVDETLSCAGGPSDRVTVQWCFITESLDKSLHKSGDHGFGSLIRADGRISYHHNLYAHHLSRNPRVGGYVSEVGQEVDFRNNIIYDWGAIPGYTGSQQPQFLRLNFVNNYYKPGPSTIESAKGYIFKVSNYSYLTSIYMAGNYLEGISKDGDAGGWELARILMSLTAEQKAKLCRTQPVESWSVKTDTTRAAYDKVLKNAGATLPKRDPIDERVVKQVSTGTGKIIDSQTQVGGWPELKTGAVPIDSDSDGMPDEWESKCELNSKDAKDGNLDADGDGFTNIEEYLNSTDAKKPDWVW